VVVYLLFSRHFLVPFWDVSTIDRNRLPAWSCPLKRVVYSTPHNHCVECLGSLEWIVLYIPFIHSRHNAKDRSLGVGRDIKQESSAVAEKPARRDSIPNSPRRNP